MASSINPGRPCPRSDPDRRVSCRSASKDVERRSFKVDCHVERLLRVVESAELVLMMTDEINTEQLAS